MDYPLFTLSPAGEGIIWIIALLLAEEAVTKALYQPSPAGRGFG